MLQLRGIDTRCEEYGEEEEEEEEEAVAAL